MRSKKNPIDLTSFYPDDWVETTFMGVKVRKPKKRRDALGRGPLDTKAGRAVWGAGKGIATGMIRASTGIPVDQLSAEKLSEKLVQAQMKKNRARRNPGKTYDFVYKPESSYVVGAAYDLIIAPDKSFSLKKRKNAPSYGGRFLGYLPNDLGPFASPDAALDIAARMESDTKTQSRQAYSGGFAERFGRVSSETSTVLAEQYETARLIEQAAYLAERYIPSLGILRNPRGARSNTVDPAKRYAAQVSTWHEQDHDWARTEQEFAALFGMTLAEYRRQAEKTRHAKTSKKNPREARSNMRRNSARSASLEEVLRMPFAALRALDGQSELRQAVIDKELLIHDSWFAEERQGTAERRAAGILLERYFDLEELVGWVRGDLFPTRDDLRGIFDRRGLNYNGLIWKELQRDQGGRFAGLPQQAWTAKENPPIRPLWKTRARRNPAQADVKLYQHILAHLRALRWLAWTLHWQASGPGFYGDHSLLQKLYSELDIEESIDQLGERMVAYFGPGSVNARQINGQTQELIARVKPELAGLLDIELSLQKLLRKTWKANQDSGEEFSLGLDDLLMGLAKERDTAVYLLQQRLRRS